MKLVLISLTGSPACHKLALVAFYDHQSNSWERVDP